MGKTIVFCVDQDHALRMRQAMVNLNGDMMQAGEWAVRITSDEGDLGRSYLEQFQNPDEPMPVVATTSRLLNTGVDVPTAKNIVLFRKVESMTEFKQMIGRGTRLDLEHGKEYFTIIDITGSTRKFEDPAFDGPPIRVVINDPAEDPPGPVPSDEGDTSAEGGEAVAEPEPDYTPIDEGELPGSDEGVAAYADDESGTNEDEDEPDLDAVARRSTRHVVEGFDVFVASEALYVMDAESGRLRRIRYEQWVRDGVRRLELEPGALRAQWASARSRRELRELLREELAFDVGELAGRLNKPDCDPIDLLIWLAWELPLVSRRDRVNLFTATERKFLDRYPPKARQILASLLDKYAAHGIEDLSPAALATPPFTEMGSPAELAQLFGGVAEFHQAIEDLGARLFAA